MKVYPNEPLSRWSYMRIGGVARAFYLPESEDELAALLRELKDEPCRLLAGGSNVLINDRATFPNVICLRDFAKTIRHLGGGLFEVGASCTASALIAEANRLGYGGLENLFGVPATVGGMCLMNAGYGHDPQNAIGSRIRGVTVLRNGERVTLNREECRFGLRSSVFQAHRDWIIVSAAVQLSPITKREAEAEREKRIAYNRGVMKKGEGSLGTVFLRFNRKLLRLVKKTTRVRAGECRLTDGGWIVNPGQGTYRGALRLIRRVTLLHRILRRPCELEIEIWDS